MSIATLYRADCLVVMSHLESESVDLILADPPYGTTENEWDAVIPLDAMWKQLRRIVKPQGAVILTASQPFTTDLIVSARDLFKYELIWEKNIPTGHVHAKNKPMKKHENVVVFSKGTTVHESQSDNRMQYFPQGVRKHQVPVRGSTNASNTVMGARPSHQSSFDVGAAGYPSSMLKFNREKKLEHPTQKPVDMFAYLVRTYSKPGDMVMDFCMGSGTTGVASIITGRDFIGIEQSAEYFAIAESRCRKFGRGGLTQRASEVRVGVTPAWPAQGRVPGRVTR